MPQVLGGQPDRLRITPQPFRVLTMHLADLPGYSLTVRSR
jgi:hypothetical protein